MPGGSSHSFSFTNTIAPLRPGDSDPNLANNTANTGFSLICVVPVKINIKPGSNPNSINPNQGGQSIAVAILSTAAGEYGLPLAFDATTVDPLSVRFGPAALVNGGGGGTEIHGRGHLEDSRELDERTRDGDIDLVLHFDDDPSGSSPASPRPASGDVDRRRRQSAPVLRLRRRPRDPVAVEGRRARPAAPSLRSAQSRATLRHHDVRLALDQVWRSRHPDRGADQHRPPVVDPDAELAARELDRRLALPAERSGDRDRAAS